MLFPTSQLCNAPLVPQFIMSKSPRSRSPAGTTGKGKECKISELDESFVALWAKHVEPKMAKKNEDFQNEIKQVVGMHVKAEVERLEKKVDTGFADIKSAIDGLKAAIATHPPVPPPAPAAPAAGGGTEVRQALRSSPLSFAEAVVAGAQQSAGNDVTTPNFNRKLNPTKLFCNLHDRAKVAKAKFEHAISVLANEANLSDSDYKVVGDPLDNRFELQFAGDTHIASVAALQFYDSLHLGRGLYKDQFVLDDQNKQIKFYVNPDKNPCQMRREILAKHLRSILAPKVADKDLFLKKQTGSVLENKRAICSVIITGPESARLEWCHPKRIELGIEQAPVEQEFSAFVIGGGPGS